MNRICIVFKLVLLLYILCSNVSQPGVYNSGGMAFTMLFPEDSLAYKKIQMREERIYIQLYKGYAVVKGVYQMVNTTSEKLSFKMGYPIKGIYHGGEVERNEVSFDSIYKFKVKSNGNELPILTNQFGDTNQVMTFVNQNWLTWQMDFLPNQKNLITVYFIVNTNNGKVSRGYSRDYLNVFTYLLESGKVWKQKIKKQGIVFIPYIDNHIKYGEKMVEILEFTKDKKWKSSDLNFVEFSNSKYQEEFDSKINQLVIIEENVNELHSKLIEVM